MIATIRGMDLRPMIDIDHFKRFNDSHGHEAGDAVLREVAVLLQAQLRVEDIASRYGGEEFMIILPEANSAAARECGERLRRAAHSLKIAYKAGNLEGIRLSVGVACHPQNGDGVESLLRAADTALYAAKANGRDQVMVAAETVSKA
jgi:diguanylate cyclase (GGDEF)-like protein